MTIEELLEAARSRLERLEPPEAAHAMAEGALLVDIRAESRRARDGVVPNALFIPRNVLEWRCELMADASQVILMCDEGYQSSLAAVALRELGLDATDLVGGYKAWRAAGLPTEPQ